MECNTNILPTWALLAMLILPTLLIIAGALKLRGGVGWDAERIAENLSPFLENSGHLPKGYHIAAIDCDGNQIPLSQVRKR